MRDALFLLLTGTVACSSPLSPSATPAPLSPTQAKTPPPPAPIALSGQSNAVGLKGFLEAYGPVVGVQQNSTPIRAWAVDGPLWPALAASLPGASAFVWWQGEADLTRIDSYPAALDDLLARVRAITGPIPIVICGVNSHSGQDAFRAMQQTYATSHRYAFVRSDDLPQSQPGELDIPTGEIPPYDFTESYHLSAEGYRQMAARVEVALTH
jgi:hypothetical protein